MTTLEEIDQMIDEFTFKHLISDTGIICNSDIVDGMNFKYSFKNSPNDLKQVELINDTMNLLEIIKKCINTYQEEEYNAEDESDIAKYTPGLSLPIVKTIVPCSVCHHPWHNTPGCVECCRPVQTENVDDMMEDMTIVD